MAETVDLLRSRRSLSVYHLALHAAIPRTTLQRRLTGEVAFTTLELWRLSQVLGVKPSDIVSAAEADLGDAA